MAPGGITATTSADPDFSVVLHCLQEDSRRYFGADTIAIEALASLTNTSSRLIRINVQADWRTLGVFVKIAAPREFTPDAVERARRGMLDEFELTTQAYVAMLPYPEHSVARPIACFPEQFCIVTEQAPGRTLRDVLRRPLCPPFNMREMTLVFERLGQWLQRFQESDARPGRISLDTMRQYLAERVSLLVSDGRADFTAVDRDSILRYFDARAAEVPAHELAEVWLHGDFCPDNVLVDGSRITLVDFARSCRGARPYDLAHMFLHLEKLKMKPWLGARFIGQLQNAMVRAFDPSLDWRGPLFQLLLMEHVICHMVQLSAAPAASRLENLYARFHWRKHMMWLRRLSLAREIAAPASS